MPHTYATVCNGVTYVTFDNDGPELLDGLITQDKHDRKVTAFRAGADFVRIVRPDGARRITYKDGRTWTFKDEREEITRDRQLELEALEKRIAELRIHWQAQGCGVARSLMEIGYPDTWSSQEIGCGPLWAEVELQELEPRAVYLRAMLRIEGHAGTQADDIAKARRRAKTAARVRAHRERKRAQAEQEATQ